MELPRPISVLVQPLSAFDQPRTDLSIAVGIVLLVAAVHTGSLWVTAGIFADTVDGTVMVENEDRPSEYRCQVHHPDIETSLDIHTEPPPGCDKPKRVPLALGDYAERVIGNAALSAGFAVVLAWLLLGWLVHLVSTNVSDYRYRETLAATAWAFVPALLPALARPIIFNVTADTYAYPNTLDALAATVESLAVGFGSIPFTVVGLVALCWQGYVLFGICTGLYEVPVHRAAVIVSILLGGFFVGSLFPIPSAPEFTFLGTLLVLSGLFSARYARGLIVFNTKFELIGMRGTRDVEPADWYVKLHQIGGSALAAFGFLLYRGFSYVV
jgi:hypothetical protein